MNLAEFLLARIAEDEAVARAAHVTTALPPIWDTGQFYGPSVPASAHIARHDPARVLAECGAKRNVIAAYWEEVSRRNLYQSDDARTVEDDMQRERRRSSAARCRGLEIALEHLAQPYRDHPDFDPAWSVT
jgi:hypothetical protein